MNKMSIILVILVLSSFLFCGKISEEQGQILLIKARDLIVKNQYPEAMDSLNLIVSKCQKEELVTQARFEIANLHQAQNKYNEAIGVYRDIISTNPKNDLTAKAQFMIGFVLAENMQNYDQAKIEFNTFIQEYPNDSLVQSAKFELENMGKSLESLPFLKDSINQKDTNQVKK